MRVLVKATAALLMFSATVGRANHMMAQTPVGTSYQAIALAYAQGASGNCPSVAITKWALATYGIRPASGTLGVTTNGDRTESLTLADGRVVTITPEQEAIAAVHSDFNPRVLSTDVNLPSVDVRKASADQANRLYAVLAVLKSRQQTDGRLISAQNFQHAFRHLDDGGDIDSLFELLGFKILDTADFPTAVPNVYGSAVHVVFVIDNVSAPYGQSLYDEHGGLEPIQTYDYSNGRHGHRWRYALKPGVGPSNTIVRQCEKSPGLWDACPNFNI